MHVVIINPENGAVVKALCFDTYEKTPAWSQWLETDAKEIPDGYIVVAAARNDCMYMMGLDGMDFFEELGSQHIELLDYRQAFAFIGIQGRKEPLEKRAMHEDNPVSITQLFKMKPAGIIEPKYIQQYDEEPVDDAPAVVMVNNFEVNETRVKDFIRIMRSIIELSRDEEGCLRFDLLRHAKEDTRFVSYEVFTNQHAIEANMDSAHYEVAYAEMTKLEIFPASNPPFISEHAGIDISPILAPPAENDPLQATPTTQLLDMEVKPASIFDFMKAVQHYTQSMRADERVLRIDLLKDQDYPCKFRIYTVYRDVADPEFWSKYFVSLPGLGTI